MTITVFKGALAVGLAAAMTGPIAARAAEAPCAAQDKDCLAIESALHDWAQAFNSGDLEGVMKVWADDVEGWYPAGDVNGRAATREQYAPITEPDYAAKIAVNIVEISVYGSNAHVRDIWTVSDSEASVTYKSFEIWKQNAAGDWRITRWISFPAPAEGEAED